MRRPWGAYADDLRKVLGMPTADSGEHPTAVEIHKRSRARAARALELRRQGLTFREIGKAMGGVTVETARQAVKKGERIEQRSAVSASPTQEKP